MARPLLLCVNGYFATNPHLFHAPEGIATQAGAQVFPFPWVMDVPGGTLRVSQTFPPMVEP